MVAASVGFQSDGTPRSGKQSFYHHLRHLPAESGYVGSGGRVLDQVLKLMGIPIPIQELVMEPGSCVTLARRLLDPDQLSVAVSDCQVPFALGKHHAIAASLDEAAIVGAVRGRP
jgi:hypothetical protein